MESIAMHHNRISGNMLKMIAALTMLIDHIGFILFPGIRSLRIIGRIAFPIYAFMIAEGCAYTKNRLRYFLSVFLLGAGCQLVYFIYGGDTQLGILITFSLSILVVYAMQHLKSTVLSAESGALKRCAAAALFLAAVAGVYFLNKCVPVDYGFWGCMVPAFASVFRKPCVWKRLDNQQIHVLMLSLGLIIVSCVLGGIQLYSLMAIPLLLAYSGKRGKINMKYFFYIFYPAHLAVLEGISYFLN